MAHEPPIAAPSHRRLVGKPLLYAMSVFASIGVFLVSCLPLFVIQRFQNTYFSSLVVWL